MAQTLTFDKVFTTTGNKNGRDWKRWDFKAGDDRYSTFSAELANLIEVGQPVTVEVEVSGGNNGYTNRTITRVLSGSQPEASQESSGSPEAVRTAPVASQDDAKGKTRAIYAAQMGVALFQSLPAEEQTMAAAKQIMETLVDYAFQS